MTGDSARREERPETIMANHGLHLTVACAPAGESRRWETRGSETKRKVGVTSCIVNKNGWPVFPECGVRRG